MVLATLAEYSLPFTFAPVMVNLAQVLAEDKVALSGLKLCCPKETHGKAEETGHGTACPGQKNEEMRFTISKLLSLTLLLLDCG